MNKIFTLTLAAVLAASFAVPAVAHHKDDHEIKGNANGLDKGDKGNNGKGKGHGPNDENHGGKHEKWAG